MWTIKHFTQRAHFDLHHVLDVVHQNERLDDQLLSKDNSCLCLYSDSLVGHPGSDSGVPPRGASPPGHRMNNELWRTKPIIHCTVQAYFWLARLRSDARGVIGPDYWVRFWVGRLPHHHLIAGLLVLMQDWAFLHSYLVLDRPNTSDFMWNLHWSLS